MKFNHRNVHISPSAKIGNNVKIGDNTIIYDNVIIGDNSIICNDCVIGEPINAYYHDDKYENPVTNIGENAMIRSHTIIYSGNQIGRNFITGHRVTVRENTKIGDFCAFGTLSDIQGNTTFGNYCRLHSNVHIGMYSTIGNFVFIYPYVVFTNDPHPPSNICQGPTVGDYSQIAVHSILLPGIKIGSNCLVGANSTVGKDFGDELLIAGTPAKVFCSVNEIKSKEKIGEFHYPWMYNFERGMPWEGIGYDTWLKNQ
jgi:acetyltransferase-like isoleucine patch superfamily enzyme